MQIGLGGGATSSVDSGELDEGLDFASVQRDNAEMERRCQKSLTAVGQWQETSQMKITIRLCRFMTWGRWFVKRHAWTCEWPRTWAVLNLRKVPSLEHGMSPMAI